MPTIIAINGIIETIQNDPMETSDILSTDKGMSRD